MTTDKNTLLTELETIQQKLEHCQEDIEFLQSADLGDLLVNGEGRTIDRLQKRCKEAREIVEDYEVLYAYIDSIGDLYYASLAVQDMIDLQKQLGKDQLQEYKDQLNAVHKKHEANLQSGNIDAALEDMRRVLSLEDLRDQEPEAYIRTEGVDAFSQVLTELNNHIEAAKPEISELESKVRQTDETRPTNF